MISGRRKCLVLGRQLLLFFYIETRWNPLFLFYFIHGKNEAVLFSYRRIPSHARGVFFFLQIEKQIRN